MAVKNSSCESTNLLLERGAHIEAKANVWHICSISFFYFIMHAKFYYAKIMLMQNGMTPLHLAVWHALQAGDCSTVSVLLSYNADCFAKDDVLLDSL